MKTLEEIRDEMAQEMGFLDWEEMFYEEGYEIGDNGIDEVAKRYAKEVAKEALKNASENAGTKREQAPMLWTPSVRIVDKRSILDEHNIPKL